VATKIKSAVPEEHATGAIKGWVSEAQPTRAGGVDIRSADGASLIRPTVDKLTNDLKQFLRVGWRFADPRYD